MSVAQSLIQAQVISFTFTFHQTDKKTEYRHFSPELIYTIEPEEGDKRITWLKD